MAKEIKQTLCRMCDNHCALNVTMENGRPTEVLPYPSHPWNQGRICMKGSGAVDFVNHKDRLTKPLKKVDGKFVEIELSQAYDEIAAKLKELKAEYGPQSVSVWKGEAIGFAQEEEIYRRFIYAFGSPNYFSNDSECFASRYLAYRIGFGCWGPPDYENAKHIVIWGSNPPAAHPNSTQFIMRGRRNGAKITVIDPRMSNMARQADHYISIIPGTDGALAMGLARVLINNNWYDKDFVENHTIGFEEYKERVQKCTPEFVEKESGVPAAMVEKLASMLHAAAPHVSIYAGNGPEHHIGGVQGIRAISMLDALLGSFDRLGGTRWPASSGVRSLALHQTMDLSHLNPIGAKEFPPVFEARQECNTMRAMDHLINGTYPLKAVIMSGANPMISSPNVAKVKAGLEKLDLLVVRELFMTETAELADYVLPAASFMERSEVHVHVPVHVINVTNRLFTIPGVDDEYTFLHELALRLDMEEYFPWKDEDELNDWVLADTPYTAEELRQHPEGIIYAPFTYEKWRNAPISTPSGKIEFRADYLIDMDRDPLPDYIPPVNEELEDSNEFPLIMTTGARRLLFFHGRYHNIKRFDEAVPTTGLEIHPNDAAKLGIVNGEEIEVSSRLGSIKVLADVVPANGIKEGVVHMSHGWKQYNINFITFDDRQDPYSGFPVMKSVPVKISKIK